MLNNVMSNATISNQVLKYQNMNYLEHIPSSSVTTVMTKRKMSYRIAIYLCDYSQVF